MLKSPVFMFMAKSPAQPIEACWWDHPYPCVWWNRRNTCWSCLCACSWWNHPYDEVNYYDKITCIHPFGEITGIHVEVTRIHEHGEIPCKTHRSERRVNESKKTFYIILKTEVLSWHVAAYWENHYLTAPRKLFIFIIKNMYFLDQSIQKNVLFNFENRSTSTAPAAVWLGPWAWFRWRSFPWGTFLLNLARCCPPRRESLSHSTPKIIYFYYQKYLFFG